MLAPRKTGTMAKATKITKIYALLFIIFSAFTVQSQVKMRLDSASLIFPKDIETGAQVLLENTSQLKGKKVAVVANHTSEINGIHLVDTLLSIGVEVTKVFAPEHGFRGIADAGAHVKSSVDEKTGLPIVSLYGSNKKPTASQLNGVEVVIFDIQDVGVRYYTYISTMHYVMEACAEQKVKVLVLDRPNPNGFYVDGPVLESKFQSFVGMHPIPVVHGLTIGELANMINGEQWLKNGIQCDLSVIKCIGYDHKHLYQLPINPSPNLGNMTAIYLYPSLGFFEGTEISVARGTHFPFQAFGNPKLTIGDFSFVPKPTSGATHPRFETQKCNGFDLRKMNEKFAVEFKGIYLKWILLTYENYPDQDNYFIKSGFFNLLAGTDKLKNQIESGATENEIRKSWEPDLANYKLVRKKYLLYPDFE